MEQSIKNQTPKILPMSWMEKAFVDEIRDTLSKSVKNPLPDTLFINLWASWCKPCKKEMPYLASLVQKARKKGHGHVGFFAVTDEAKSKSQKVREDHTAFFKNYTGVYKTESIKRAIFALRERRAFPANLVIMGDSCVYRGGYTDSIDQRKIEKLLF